MRPSLKSRRCSRRCRAVAARTRRSIRQGPAPASTPLGSGSAAAASLGASTRTCGSERMSEAHKLILSGLRRATTLLELLRAWALRRPSGGRVGGVVGVAPPPGEALPLGTSGAVPAVAAARASAQLPAASIGILAAAVAAAGAVVSDFFRIEPAGLDRFFSTAAVKPPPYFAAIRSSAAALPPVTDDRRTIGRAGAALGSSAVAARRPARTTASARPEPAARTSRGGGACCERSAEQTVRSLGEREIG